MRPQVRLALFPLLFLLAALAHPAQTTAETCGLLWRVDTTVGESYLFGTVHSEDPRVLELAPPARDAFGDSGTFVMEMIPDLGSMAELVRSMHFQDQRNLRTVLGEELYRESVEALSERGIGEGLAVKLKPWAVAVTLSFPQPESGMFLDLMLYNRALQQGKSTAGLESVSEQLAFFQNLDQDEQIQLLKSTLANREQLDAATESMIDAYLERDPERLLALSRQYLSELPGSLAERFHEEAIVGRNRLMAQRLQPHLENSDVFAAVGALHLFGEEGLVSLLREEGYAVECVY